MPGGYEIPIRCGKCGPCRYVHAQSWALRLIIESMDYPQCVSFLTLTYDETNIPRTPAGYPTVKADDITAFIKRLRKNTGLKLRYYGHTEYGNAPTYRPHIHILLFGANYLTYRPKTAWKPSTEDQARLKLNNTDWKGYGWFELEVLKAWQCRGGITVTPGDESRIRYVSEHQLKGLVDSRKLLPGQEPQSSRMSRKPAFGTAGIERLAAQMKKKGIYPEDMGAELLVDDPIEVPAAALTYQKSSRPGAVNHLGGMKKSSRKKNSYLMGRVLKKKLVDALGGDQREVSDKELEQYQRLTVGDGPIDPEEKARIDRWHAKKMEKLEKRKQAF